MSFEVVDAKRVRLFHQLNEIIVDQMATNQEDDPLTFETMYSAVFDSSRLPQVASVVKLSCDFETRLLQCFKPFAPVCDIPDRIPTIWAMMREYQREGAKFLIERKRSMLFDAPGLGKTIQSLALAEYYGGKILIVCPASNQIQWCVEGVKKFANKSSVVLTRDTLHLLGKDGYYVVTYEAGRDRLRDEIKKVKWTTIVFDEAQKFKTPDSLQTKKWLIDVKSAGRQAQNVVFLTGTPLSRARFNQLYGMMSCCFLEMEWRSWNRGEFAQRYCNGKIDPITNQWTADYISRVPEFLALLFTRALRRSKQVLSRDLPPKTRTIQYIQLTDDELKEYTDVEDERKQVAKDMYLAESKRDGPETKRLRRRLCNLKSELRRKLAKAKQRACCEFLRSRMHLPGKEIMFCDHVIMREALLEECAAQGVKAIEINGDVATHVRQDLVKELSSEDTDAKIGVFSIMAAGSGLNCTPGVRRVTFCELSWNPSDADQCEDRAWRFGTIHPIEVVYLVARGTVEESIVTSHEQKSRDVNDLLDGGKSPERGYDSPIVLKLVDWGIDAQFARDLNLTRLPSTVDDFIEEMKSGTPPNKVYVKCDVQSEEYETWTGDNARWIETDTEFIAFQLKSHL